MAGSASFLQGSTKVTTKQIISVLPNSYTLLADIPTLNGMSILGDLTTKELSILSAKSSDYETMTLSSMTDKDTKYIPILSEDEEDEPQKVSVQDFMDQAQAAIVSTSLDEDAAVGSIQFVINN